MLLSDRQLEDLQAVLVEAVHDLAGEIRHVNRANGWRAPTMEDWPLPADKDTPGLEPILKLYKIPAFLALVHSEASEALEAFRKGDLENFKEELADIFIRLLDLSCSMDVDLVPAVFAKLGRNRERGFKHGGKLI